MTKLDGVKKPITKCNGKCVIQFGKKQDKKYNMNKMIYQRGLSYIPKLISFDDDTKTLIIEKVGRTIAEKYGAGEGRDRYLPKMRTLSKKFYNSFGLYHNDLKWDNTLEDNNGKVYLIDFEYSSPRLHKINTHSYRAKGKLYNFNY